MNLKRLNIPFFLLMLALFSASWDVFMQIRVGGFTLRFTQGVILLLVTLVMLRTFAKGRQIIPLGFGSLLLWAAFIFAFIPHAGLPLRAILYAIWLLFCIVSIYIFVQLINTRERLETAIRWYIYSFVFVAIFGLLQFLVGFAGISLLTNQWIFPGRLARINGFNYEPSFFAIYMMQGFILTAYLREKKTTIMPRRHLNVCYLLMATVLLASTSRASWLVCYLWFARPLFYFLWRVFKGRFYPSSFKKSFFKVLLPTTFLLILVVILVQVFSIRFFISGITFLGGGSHSSGARWNTFMDLVYIFMDSPLIGYSLGGLCPAIANLHGVTLTSVEMAKEFEGTGVFMEILAASGLIGILPFISYLWQIMVKPVKLAKKLPDDNSTKDIILGLVISLLFTFIIVQSGQNILRMYIWYHIALLSAAYAVAKRLVITEEAPLVAVSDWQNSYPN